MSCRTVLPLIAVALLTSCRDSLEPAEIEVPSFEAAESKFRPGSARLVFLSDRGGPDADIWTVNSDGSDLTRLTADGLANQSPTPSPDGRHIIFGACVLPCPLPPAGPPDGIWTIMPDGNDPRRISGSRITGNGGAAWSPDGKRFMYGAATVPCDDDLRVANADGTGDSLFIGAFPGVAESNTVIPAWATNNTIAFVGRNCGSSTGTVYVTDLNRSHLRLVTDGVWVDVTGDAQRLVVQRLRGNNAYDIWVANVDGSHLTRLTSDSNNVNPAWSRDGRWIAFVRGPEGAGRGNLYIMRSDGSDMRRVTTGESSSDTEPKWIAVARQHR
jgi:Tol biopolymer transport system component